MYGYIYKTTNLVNGKIYVGQKKSKTFLGNKYLGSGKKLNDSIKHYKKENFKVELIEQIETKDLMDEREIYWIKYYNATNKEIGYNISEGGNVNRTMVGQNNPRWGKHWDESHKLHQSNILKQKYASGEVLNPNKGKHLTEKTKNKIKLNHKHAKGMLNKKLTIEQREKLKMSKKGCKSAIKNKIRMYHSETYKQIYVFHYDISLYESKGYIKGTSPKVIEKRLGKKSNSKRRKKILCLETNEIFDSIADVLKKYNFSRPTLLTHLKSGQKIKMLNLTFKNISGENLQNE